MTAFYFYGAAACFLFALGAWWADHHPPRRAQTLRGPFRVVRQGGVRHTRPSTERRTIGDARSNPRKRLSAAKDWAGEGVGPQRW